MPEIKIQAKDSNGRVDKRIRTAEILNKWLSDNGFDIKASHDEKQDRPIICTKEIGDDYETYYVYRQADA